MKKVLIVDDMAICREPIAEALRARGYDVVCAGGGEEALSALRERQPDVMLLDMGMPDMDGLAVLRALRSDPQWRALPVIMLTDDDHRDRVLEAARYGIHAYLLKAAFSLNALLAHLDASASKPGVPRETPAHQDPTHAARPRLQVQRIHGAASTSPAPSAANAGLQGRQPAPPSSKAAPPRPDAASRAELKPVITREELIRLVNKGLELRPLGATVHNVIAATSTANCSVEGVAKAVSQDQSLSIRVLKLANSSAYSRGRSVDSVKEAVTRIGVQEVRTMVMALGVLHQYEEAGAGSVDPRLFWEHCTACGLAAAAIARARHAKNLDEYFLWGTLHDIGRLILFEQVPEAYAQVWDAAHHLDLPLESVEAKLMLLDHGDVLEQALQYWKFPRDFIVPVVSHHRSMATIRRLGPQHGEAAAVIALADRLAHALLLGSSGNDVIYPLEELAEFLSLAPSVLTGIGEKVIRETHDLKFSMLARVNEEDWPDLAKMIQERMGTPLRALCAGGSPDANAARMFVDRITSASGDETPNLAIVYLRKEDDLSKLVARLEAEERSAGASNLPLLLLMMTAGHRADLDHVLLRRRQTRQLHLPTRVDRFLECAGELLKSASVEPQLSGSR